MVMKTSHLSQHLPSSVGFGTAASFGIVSTAPIANVFFPVLATVDVALAV